MYKFCNICPNNCGVNRNEYNLGVCGCSKDIKIAKYYLHPFEEPLISGINGSGTIFFTGCSLKCVFCQNYELSRNTLGKIITERQLADIFKELEDKGAHNINLVTPTHYTYNIIKAFDIYKPNIPVVYNTHSYENVSTLKDIDPYIDVYLADLKFKNPIVSKRYTNKENYFEIAENSIKFMMNSKKTVIENGLIKSGTIIRHLVLPLCTNDSIDIVNWFKQHNTNNAIFSLMGQYTPMGDIKNYNELNRKITKKEYSRVLASVLELPESQCFIQELSSADKKFIPNWDF